MTVREVIIGDARLILADCREVLPTVEADVMVTDPVWPNCPAGLLPSADDPLALWTETLAALPALRRIIVVMRCDSDPRFLGPIPSALRFFRSIQLPYAIPGYLGRVLGGDETAYWFGDPIRAQAGRRVIPGRAPVAQPGQRPPNGHPCSRCQSHFDWLLNWSADEGETILDPFMGSGTTGVAAALWGLPFIGIEIDPVYFDIACKRIEKARQQPRLFADAPVGAPYCDLLTGEPA